MAGMSDILQMIAAQGGGGDQSASPSVGIMGPVLQAIAKARPQQSGPSFPLEVILASAGQNARNIDFGFSAAPPNFIDERAPGNRPFLDPFGQFGANTPREGISPVQWLKSGGKGSINIGEAFASRHGQSKAEIMKWAPALGMQRYADFNAAMPTQVMRILDKKTMGDGTAGYQQPETGGAVIDYAKANYGLRGIPETRGLSLSERHFVGLDPRDAYPPDRMAQADANEQDMYSGSKVFGHEIASHGVTQNLDPTYARSLTDGAESVLGRRRADLQKKETYASGESPLGYLLGLNRSNPTKSLPPQGQATELIAHITDLAAGIHPMMLAQQMYEKENPGKDFLSAPEEVKNTYFAKGFMEFKKKAAQLKVPSRSSDRIIQKKLSNGQADKLFQSVLKDWAADKTAQGQESQHA